MKFDFRFTHLCSEMLLESVVHIKAAEHRWCTPLTLRSTGNCGAIDESLLLHSSLLASLPKRWSRMRMGNGHEILSLGGVRIRRYLVS